MPLPASFSFSQASLQDYTDCPRRFQLRYMLGVRWPVAREDAIADWAKRAQLGAAFHRLVHQHTVGIPEAALTATMVTEELRRWWSNYIRSLRQMPPPGLAPLSAPGALRQSEVRLTTPLAGYRLIARYDLLAIKPGKRAVVVDWKTNERRPPRARLESSWQTRVYRHVLVQAGAQFNADELHPQGVPWAPDQVELIYWFANYPAQPERFPYDDGQYTEDEWTLKATIAEIASNAQGAASKEWVLTDDLKQCRYCAYRTLCDRAKVDAEEPEWEPADDEEAFDLEIDLEQIAEIEF